LGVTPTLEMVFGTKAKSRCECMGSGIPFPLFLGLPFRTIPKKSSTAFPHAKKTSAEQSAFHFQKKIRKTKLSDFSNLKNKFLWHTITSLFICIVQNATLSFLNQTPEYLNHSLDNTTVRQNHLQYILAFYLSK